MVAFFAAVMDTVTTYTGLSPAAFFTILALMCVVYKTVCSMFVDPEPPEDLKNKLISSSAAASAATAANFSNQTVIPETVQLGEVTEHELRAYDGSDPNKPLLMAIKGQIYDVSRSRMFYGPGGPYAMFAGRDASRALALMSFDPQDLTGNIEGLSDSELEVLQDWEYKFMEKYVKVGQIVSEQTSKPTKNGDKVPENQNHDGA
ncbi:Membrane steroid-binding protein 2 [Citrus sinensis]|uniref:Cytochrome b5 heme-binding domain-containing protein n=2 Tax=Citrus clementina TaxID=85681 RepID=V4UQI4_CITCL|nr:membrane steroid-binding protein 2 isoform X1 [Citrus x clementina]XP_006491794.1 membrane steroid-binding protein 2-like isoform X1 [Citrus sinensis]ESR41769.1 hypothetical protein CICLE_v10012804mg [Citrus x clementina]KAH9670995.1 Membrane steroid-binding protein 2 [Citrus sinensis]